MSSVGDLVAYLTVNNAGFRQGFAAAQTVAKTGAASITAAIAPISGVLAPLTAALGAAFGAGSAISAAKEDARAMQKLEAVLKATGGAAGYSAEEIGAYASELQKATNYGDEVTVGAAAIIASFKNIRGDNFKTAIALAQDMATVLNIDLDSAAKKLGKTLKSVAPEDVGKKLAEMQSQFGGAAAAVADPWTQLSNIIGDIGEQVGNILLPHVNNFSEALMGVASDGVDTFASLQQANQDWADAIAVTYGTLGDQAYLTYLQWELFAVQTAGVLQHLLTEQAPAWVAWFGDNWQDVFFTMGDYALTILSNLGENIRTVWQAVLDFIARKPLQLDFKLLTEGAVNAIKSLPNIPDRVASEFEKSLQEDIAAQQAFLNQSQQNIAQGIQTRRANKEASKAIVPQEQDATGKKKDLKFGALQQGSADALSAIFKAMRGTSEDKMLAAEEEQVEQNDEMLTVLRDIRDGGLGGAQIVAGGLT